MKSFLHLISSSLFLFLSTGVFGQLVINEVDSDTPGTDMMEFIELYGAPGSSLDGYVLVLFNGLNDQSYGAFDLDGYSLDANGFFVAGNSAVLNVDMIITNNVMQNGADAVALYLGNSSSWPNGSALTNENLIDAVVYDTDDADDIQLLNLTPGQPQVNESENLFPTEHSISRVPDGGTALETTTYVAQLPTPGFSNSLQCLAGTVLTANGQASFTICTDANVAPVELQFSQDALYADYAWIVTQGNNEQIDQVFYTPFFNPEGLGEGICRIYGLAYDGTLDPATIESGDNLNYVQAGTCAAISFNYITVTKELCNDPECIAGTVGDAFGDTYIVVCLDENTDPVTFTTTSIPTASSYTWILTNATGQIIELLTGNTFDFNTLPEGTYRVYGVSHEGALNDFSIEPGDPILGVSNEGYCIDISTNYITLITQPCELAPGCSDVFFSEYIEGTSNNKALELYNPTDSNIDLDGYVIHTYNNGSAEPTNSFELSGIIEAGEVYIISHTQADPFITSQATYTSNVTWYNGNDAVVLERDGVAIDAIGIPGIDPGTPWVVGSGSAGEHTLVRKLNVTAGTTDWVLGSSQWDVYPQNTFSFIGSHSFLGCEFLNTPQIGFSSAAQNVQENIGTVNVTVNIFNPLYDVEVTINYTGGTATVGEDFNNPFPVTLTFPAGETNPQTIQVPVIDDEFEELSENIQLELTTLSEVTLLQTAQTITILPNDFVIPFYYINQISNNNENGVADSLGVLCTLQGIVHGLNTYPQGFQFTLIDPTDGINVFSGDDNFGYTVTEGDEVQISGTITQFNGLTQIEPQSFILLSQGNDINEPEIVNELNELTESQVVELKCITLVDESQWTNVSPGFNVEVTDGQDIWEVRIDEDTDIFGTSAPQGHFSVGGIGGQFDSSEPFDTGYQLLPRYLNDFSEPVVAYFTMNNEYSFGEGENVNIVPLNQSSDGTLYVWNFGDGTTSFEVDPAHTYEFDFLLQNPVVTVTLTVTGAEGCTDTYSVDLIMTYTDVEEQILTPALQVFPNPSVDIVTISWQEEVEELFVRNIFGQTVARVKTTGLKNIQIDLSHYGSGQYQITGRTSQGIITVPVIKI